MLDADLAKLYGVTTKALNQAMRRNRTRFPEDFAFRLSREELDHIRSQIVTTSDHRRGMWSQIVTTSQKYRRSTFFSAFSLSAFQLFRYVRHVLTHQEYDAGKWKE